MRIGWIGTGILGSAILQKLSSQFEITAWNRTNHKVDRLTEFGIKKANTLKELAFHSDIIFLCVKGEDIYEELLFHQQNGLVLFLNPNTLIVDTSTISPATATHLSEKLKSYNMRYMECPVSGGPEGALSGNLTGIMAGEYQDTEEAKEVINLFCSPVHYVGKVGQAQLIKVLNNLAESINLLGAAEVVNIGLSLGISLDVLHKVLSTTRGYSVYMGVLFDRLLNPTEEVSASLDVRLKDIHLANTIASDHHLWLPMGALTKELLKLALNKCGSDADQTNCFKIYQK